MTPDELVKAAGEAFLERDRVPSYSFDDCIRAAIAVVLEEAARVAERRGRQMEKIGTTPGKRRHLEWMVEGYMDAAAAIRAMIKKKETDT